MGALLVWATLTHSTGLMLALDQSIDPDLTVLTHQGDSYSVTVTYGPETGIPSDAQLLVQAIVDEEAYNEYYEQIVAVLNEDQAAGILLFDISLVKDGAELEPLEGSTVSVSISTNETLPEDTCVVHLPDDEEGEVIVPEVKDTGDGSEVSFEAEAFSAYAIVAGPQQVPLGWHALSSLDELVAWAAKTPPVGLYVGNPNGYYMMNTLTGDSSRMGITKTKPATSTPPDAAALYYFEQVPGTTNQFYAYCYDGSTKQYVYNNGNNSLSFTDEAHKTAFTVSVSNGNFTFKNGNWYWNMQGGANGSRFCSYNTVGDVNNNFQLMFRSTDTSDPYLLDGQSYGLMSYIPGINGRAMMSTSSEAGHLDAQLMAVMQDENNHSNRLFVPKDSDISMWKFTWVNDDCYTVSTMVGGVEQYLNIDDSGIVYSSTPVALRIVPGSGENEGKIRLVTVDGLHAVGYSGNISDGFVSTTNGVFLNLVSLSELSSDYVTVHSARKISTCDMVNGQTVIIYTRVYNEETKKYEFFAIDQDGTLKRCYEDGDSIEWIGEAINTLLWDFTEYYYEDTNTPNFYYDFQNESSGLYLAPQVTNNQALSDTKIGVQLSGRERGEYHTTIRAWDDADYHFSGLSSDGTQILPVQVQSGDTSTRIVNQEFYFAVMQEMYDENELHTVPTLDNNTYGITMRMVDFNSKEIKGTGCSTTQEQHDVMGYSVYDGNVSRTPGLVETALGDDGYPVAHYTQKSFAELFGNAETVNHIFLSSIYNSSGYFEFDSSQNYAHINPDGNFTVYQELGSYDNAGTKGSLKHGQFFPYDDLTPGTFCTTNGQNLYAIDGKTLLKDNNPRKYEHLYMIGNGNPDKYFGVELETSFVQTPSGKDDWGHDIIYEFTGDDDFWLFVDEELVLDLGGIHSAVSGSINFATGEVFMDGHEYSLRDIYFNNLIGRGMTEQAANAELAEIFDASGTFKDYTFHTMKIYYMERGGGSSNLHMRFNQSSVNPDTILLSKEIKGSNVSSMLVEFPFQIYYAEEEDTPIEDYTLLENTDENIKVYYQGTTRQVDYEASHTIEGVTYNSVFLLEAGETCEIHMPHDAIKYYIKECGVDSEIYDHVYVNGEEIIGVVVPANQHLDYSITPMKVKQRTSVNFVNEVNHQKTQTLTFTKWLYDEHGLTEIYDENTTFSYRLYIDQTFSETNPTYDYMRNHAVYMHDYYVRDIDGNYCEWVPGTGFVSTGIDDFDSMTPQQQNQVRFTTSANGSISKIPAFYTVEVRNLLPGTHYMVEERDSEIPDGFSRSGYAYYDDKDVFPLTKTWSPHNMNDVVAVGTTAIGEDPHIDICNLKGWGIRAYKDWADDAYMSDRKPTYFAIYTSTDGQNYTLVDNTVHQLTFGSESAYWYFPELAPGYNLSNYHVFEVTIDNADTATVVNGVVTDPQNVQRVLDGGEITIGGKIKGEQDFSPCAYTVDYEEGTQVNNVRVDHILNDRHGLVINKYEWDYTTPIEGVRFVIQESNDPSVKFGPFESDANGFVTMAFLREGVDYTITETKSVGGYMVIPSPITIRLTNDGQTVTVTGADDYHQETQGSSTSQPVIDLRNMPYDFTVIKTDENGTPLEGAHFSMHKWKVVGGVGAPDSTPMTGFEDIISDENGILQMPSGSAKTWEESWKELPAGTYVLVEKEDEMPGGFQKLPFSIRFTISETGGITLEGTYPLDMIDLKRTDHDDHVDYVMTVVNKYLMTLKITKTVDGNFGSKTKKFEFTVALKDENNQPMTGKISVLYSDGRTQKLTLNNGTIKVYLAHGEYVIIQGLHQRSRFTVTEEDAGYLVFCGLEGDQLQEKTAVSGIVDSDQVTVNFLNRRAGILPTGLDFTFRAIVGAVLVISSGMATFLFLQKRRRDDEDEEPEL